MPTVETTALDLTFRIETPARDLADAVGNVVSHLRPPPPQRGRVADFDVHLAERGDEVKIRVSDRPDQPLTVPRGEAVTWVLRQIQWRVFTCSSLVAVHGAGVVGEEGAIVLPAPSESGKSTLAAGFVRHGFDYLSDEIVGFEVPNGEIHGFPKPMSLDPGSWPVLPELEPAVDDVTGRFQTEQWQVDPEVIRPGSVRHRSHLRYVLFPRYRAGAETDLRPLSRSAALERTIKATFGFVRHGRGGLDALVRALRGADCYELDVGDLATACELIGELSRPPVRAEAAAT